MVSEADMQEHPARKMHVEYHVQQAASRSRCLCHRCHPTLERSDPTLNEKNQTKR